MSAPGTLNDLAPSDEHQQLLIVDDDVLLAEGIAAAAAGAGFASVQTITGAEMVPRVMRGYPASIVLVDLDLATARNFHLPRSIVTEFPESRVVLIVDDDYDRRDAIEALVAGASGIVFRNQGMASLLKVLEVVRQGDAAIPRQLSLSLLERLRQRPLASPAEVRLSERQIEVLELVCQRMSDQQIADALRISPITVRSHLKSIFEKIGVSNRVDAAAWARAQLRDRPLMP